MANRDRTVKLGSTTDVATRLRRRRLAERVIEHNPQLRTIPLQTIVDQIVPAEDTTARVRQVRPDLTRVRAWQLSGEFQKEGWFAPGVTLVNSLDHRATVIQERRRLDSKKMNGQMGGRPKR